MLQVTNLEHAIIPACCVPITGAMEWQHEGEVVQCNPAAGRFKCGAHNNMHLLCMPGNTVAVREWCDQLARVFLSHLQAS
jgi:hypothetical protein